MSEERRDRLSQKRMNFQFSNVTRKPEAIRHQALRELRSTASAIQLQLGESYQGEQNLQNALLNACKPEIWAHRLATMPTLRLLDVEESLARAFIGEEYMSWVQIQKRSPVFSNDVNFSSKLGMPYRRYGSHKSESRNSIGRKTCQQKDGKNPIRNYKRLLCRSCLSDEHLLIECAKVPPSNRTQLVKIVFALENVTSDSDECCNALDEIQEFDDERRDY